ncbi:low density lipoprotein receptor adapter protein 1 isoform X4 [Ursus maritimus]|uniref:Low density lipoprotein receptor adapter protein 1 n=1 Tax=Ursus maritimus TaxID=29073 RepID=A0A8M1EVX9_URSMA|nr:low density lipoprotein receptor adapter protein 1 isoform X4 [Ursus maritimus]
MDALKSAGRALIRSPSLAKQSWGGGGRHRKLPENWTDTRETLLEGMLFSLKYLGMTLVEQPKGEELSAAAVKRIVATAKASGKKLQKVTLKVSPRGIILTDNITNQLIENVSIYRISYCTADKMHDKVFAYIAQSQHNENLECHAFLCTKRKMAQAVTLTVAQAFKVAFEFWQVSKEEKEKREKASQEGGDVLGGGLRDSTPSLKSLVATGNLLDLEEMAKAPLSTVSANTTNVDEAPRPQALNNSSVVWELDDGLDEAFSRWLRDGKRGSGAQAPQIQPRALSSTPGHHPPRGLRRASPRRLTDMRSSLNALVLHFSHLYLPSLAILKPAVHSPWRRKCTDHSFTLTWGFVNFYSWNTVGLCSQCRCAEGSAHRNHAGTLADGAAAVSSAHTEDLGLGGGSRASPAQLLLTWRVSLTFASGSVWSAIPLNSHIVFLRCVLLLTTPPL